MKNEKYFFGQRFFWIIFGTLFFSQGIWLLAFWPGLATFDSLSQWQQAVTASYNNAHPFIYSLAMRISYLLAGSPWLVSLTQILIFSLLVSWIFVTLKNKGLNKYLILLLTLIISVWPQFGIFNVTLWKDVPYSFAVVWLSMLSYLAISEKDLKKYQWPIIISSLFCALLRHNGVIFLVLPYLLLLIFLPKPRRLIVRIFAITITAYLLLAFGMAGLLGVRKAPLVSEAFRIKIVAAIYHSNNPNLSTAERETFSQLIPESDWKNHYDCAYVDNLYLNYFLKPRNLTFENTHFASDAYENKWHKAVISAAVRNVGAIVRDRSCLGKYILGVGKYSNFYVAKSTIVTGLPEITEQSKLPKIRQVLADYLNWSSGNIILFYIFWASWPGSLLLLIVAVYSILKKQWCLFAFASLIVANTIFVILVSPAADGRYLYATNIAFFVLIAIITAKSKIARNKGVN